MLTMLKSVAEKLEIDETMNRDVYEHWLKDYLKNSSVAGCVHYASKGSRFGDRLFWFLVHMICVALLAFMIFDTTKKFRQSPTVTTPESETRPIQEILFPGVAICYVNKINYSAAAELARDISEDNQIENLTPEELTRTLKYLGHLYLFEFPDDEEEAINLLHDILIKRYKNYIPKIMFELAPDVDCRHMLQHCNWAGKEQICEDLFHPRITTEGYCCTFNYARRTDAFEGTKSSTRSWEFLDILHPQTIGSQFGLTVLIRPDVDNHYYKIHSTRGYKMLIFPSLDFPDVSSGGLREVLVAPRTATSLTLDAVPFYSAPAVSRFTVAERGCLFNYELPLIFGNYYSYSDCLIYCKITDIRESCKCIPFFYPTDRESVRRCDLRDLPCLHKYRDKWTKVNPKPEDRAVPFPSNELSNGLNCSECFPACADVFYKVSVSSAPMSAATVHMGRDTYELNDQSIVHVFFKHPGMTRLKKDVLYNWYDLMSNYGGICGLFLGVSFISVAEFVYFFTLRLCVREKTLKNEFAKSRGVRRLTIVEPNLRSDLPPLYWGEFVHTNGRY